MFKIIEKIVRKFIFAVVALYGLNMILYAVDVTIPINIITVSAVTALGIPGLLSLVAMFLIIC